VTDSLQSYLQSLPEDNEALRALILATFAERDAAVTERDILLAQNDRLRHLLLKLTRMQFGADPNGFRKINSSWAWKPSSRRSPKTRPKRRSRTPNSVRTTRRSGVRAAARCRLTCRGSK
jgi:hypothetical protein